ncbi:hypothetical protein ACWGII_41185 [Streptomyces sp. NPDC054855]
MAEQPEPEEEELSDTGRHDGMRTLRSRFQASRVFNPTLDVRSQHFAREAALYGPPEVELPAIQSLVVGIPAGVVGGLVIWAAEVTEKIDGGRWAPWLAGALALAMILVAGARTVPLVRQSRKLQALQARHGDVWISPADLTPEGNALLARAQMARAEILASQVHARGLVDADRNSVALPEQEWELAQGLRAYRNLLQQAPKKPSGAKSAELAADRLRTLDAGLGKLTDRVKALETFAAQVREADERWRELQEIEQLSGDSEQVLDFLASTARDDLAVQEIQGFTGEADVVTKALADALTSAKGAAALALPQLDAAGEPERPTS